MSCPWHDQTALCPKGVCRGNINPPPEQSEKYRLQFSQNKSTRLMFSLHSADRHCLHDLPNLIWIKPNLHLCAGLYGHSPRSTAALPSNRLASVVIKRPWHQPANTHTDPCGAQTGGDDVILCQPALAARRPTQTRFTSEVRMPIIKYETNASSP